MSKGITFMGRRVRLRFPLFLILIITLVFFANRIISKPSLYGTVQYGEIATWEEYTGLVARDEQVYTAPDYGKVDYFVDRGELVDKDALVAMVYKQEYSQELIDSLYQVQQKISDYQHENIVTDMIDRDFDTINQNIDESIQSLQSYSYANGAGNIDKMEKELRTLLERRKTLLDKRDLSDSYLEGLYEDEKAIEDKLSEWKIEIPAEDAGFVGLEIDGLEDILNPSIVDRITMDEYMAFIDHPSEPLERDNGIDSPLFKIVDPNTWYIISLIPHVEVFYKEGDKVQVKLDGPSETAVGSMVNRVEHFKKSTLVVLEMSEAVEQVLETRSVYGDIGSTVEGLMVPNNAIMEKQSGTGIKVEKGGETEYIPVKIRAKDDKWAIVEPEKSEYDINLNDSVLIN